MAQGGDNSWIRDVILSSPVIQLGIAAGAIGAGVYFARGAVKRIFGNGNGDTEKTRLALDALSKVNDAQARLIEYYQEHESHFEQTELGKNTTRPIPLDDLDVEDD